MHMWHDSFINVWRDPFICVTWHIHMCDITHSYVWHDIFICVTWLIHMCDMTHSYVWHDSFICETWPNHMWDMTHSYVWHDSFICAIWLLHICDMTHSYMGHDSITCVTWLIHTWDMAHAYVTWLLHICVTWLIHMRNMTQSHVRHDSFIRETWLMHNHVWSMNESCLTCDWVMSHIYMSHVTHIWTSHGHIRHGSCIRAMTPSYVTCLILVWCDINVTHSRGTWLIYVIFCTANGGLIDTHMMRHITHSYVLWHDSFVFYGHDNPFAGHELIFWREWENLATSRRTG